MPEKKTSWYKYLVVAAAIAAAYFANVEIQTYFGKKALEEMGLERHALPAAMQKAHAENKLVLADLSAIWCPTCRNLDKQVFSNPAVQKAINKKYVFSRIEYESDEGESFMEMYDARSFPTLLILSPSGEKLRELPVTTNPDEFIQSL
ncbi:hypothetical protein VDG1235_129 [Verrucomicrobiia bacterium DG1235]|nr:hypothetical protein VDG1235_129 [Verrucomicrobiae bacterium DG1235]